MTDTWLCTAHIFGCRGCKQKCGCGTDPTCTGVSLNPWTVYNYQQHALANCDTVRPLKSGRRYMPLSRLRPGCDQYRPFPHNTPNGDPLAFWYSPNNSFSAGFGYLIHELEIDHPRERERMTSKLDAVGCTLTGRRYGRIVIEAAGRTPAESRHLKETLIRWLVEGEQQSCDRCEGRTMEVWRDCCVSDEGRTGRRLLTDVRGWIDTTPETGDPVTDCGCVFQLEFSAADELREVDGKVDGPGEWVDGWQCEPTDPVETEIVEIERLVPKTVKLVDLKARTDGSLISCPVDFDPADLSASTPDECYFQVRNVELLDRAVCCPPELDAQVAPDGTISYTPRQPDVWADYLAQVAVDGVDCACPPTIATFRIPNINYDPAGCADCPTEFKAAQCAADAGLTVDPDGLIGFPLGPGDYPLTGTPGLPAIVNYAVCMGYIPSPSPWCVDVGGPGSIAEISILTGGQIGIVCTDPASNVYRFPADLTTAEPMLGWDATPFGGVEHPVPSEDELEGCADEVNANCLPWITVVPTGAGGPCTTLTLNPDGSIVSSVNLALNDATNMTFDWVPCSNLTDPDCAGQIPAQPGVTVNLGAGDWAENGWTVGAGWPAEIGGDQYTISETEWGPNTPDPAVVTETVEQAVTGDGCDGPCTPARPTYQPAEPAKCGPVCADPLRRHWTGTATGLDPNTDYLLDLNIPASVNGLNQVTVTVEFGDPECPTLQQTCIAAVPESSQFQLDDSDPVVVDSDGCLCDARGWLAAYERPVVRCSETATITVSYSWCETEADGVPPEPSWCLTPASAI